MELARVLPDSNVCYPISLLDLILRLDEADIHRVLWTEDLLAELHRTWLRNGARSTASATAICDAIRRTFPAGEIERRDYEDLIAEMPGKDPDDHVHAAMSAHMYRSLDCDYRAPPGPTIPVLSAQKPNLERGRGRHHGRIYCPHRARTSTIWRWDSRRCARCGSAVTSSRCRSSTPPDSPYL